jgi:acyl-coenzyme A synthetase/AMP-(fatty) acid ligase/pimeloyl-ACP methyl ester carboxylesterase
VIRGFTAPATLPPPTIAGLDPAWSRLVTAPDLDGVGRTFHVLDNRVADPTVTLLCVHGNPTWSYLWRTLLARADPHTRVVAIDQLDMGFSERTGTRRRLQQRVDDLCALTDQLDLVGPVVVVAHDWGGPISLGWIARHRPQVTGLVLTNTAVHQPAGSPAPALIRLARLPGILQTVCVRTPAFIESTLRLSRPPLAKSVRRAYHAPYRTAERRAAIGGFVADIPLEDAHPSTAALEWIVASVADLADVPTLLLWGPSDPVFSDLYLRDLQARLPHADVHRFVGASHLVAEDADVAGTVYSWLARGHARPPAAAPGPERATAWAALDRRAGDHELAMIELTKTGRGRSMTFAELDADVNRVAAGLADMGVAKGDRVALLVPPGLDLTACLYACWRVGAVIVLVDAGLGARGISNALKSAAPSYLIGIPRALAAARALRWPGRRISTVPMAASRGRALGVTTTLDEIRERGNGRAAPAVPDANDTAVVAFTSGATGPAKGVVYLHQQLQAQRDALARHYEVKPDDRLVAAFAPFALYGPAIGIPSVVPDMDVTAPGTLRAAALADAVGAVRATLVFAAPAALTNVIATADELSPTQRASLSGVRLLLSAGAPVSPRILRAVSELMPNAELHTPYGMTEVLAVCDITLVGIEAAGSGNGVCVGHPLDEVTIAISPLDHAGRATGAFTDEPNVTGEVCIQAEHVKDHYDKLWRTQDASAQPAGWHRSGDVGHLDREGRLWIEGRLVHVITTAAGPVTPVGIEQAAESVAGVRLAAAVGIGPAETQQVVIVAVADGTRRRAGLAPGALADDVRAAVRTAVGADVAAVLVAPKLPVDKRHNSKIDRIRVGRWAARALAGGRITRL